MYIRCKKDYMNILEMLKKEANEVNGTYEFTGESIQIKASTTSIKELFKISDSFEHDFIESLSIFKEGMIGPYDMSKYHFIIPAIKKAIKQLVDDNLETRRCVVQFPPEHCFQAVQFLIRENTVHVVCFMRSCDAIKNLPHDIWLCSKMADIFSSYVSKVKNEQPYHFYDITMNFGSLHAYKEDIYNVFRDA